MAVFLSSVLGLKLEGVMGDTACTNLAISICNVDMTIVDCRGRGLTSIPDIPSTALELMLSHNRINALPTRVFSNLSKLQTLLLDDNQIQTIERSAFEGLESLTSVYLSYNIIDTIPESLFSNLSKLQRLFLDNNQIQIVERLAFEGLESLTYIDLYYNRIHKIRAQAFSKLPKIQTLNMSHNKIRTVEALAFEGLESLRCVNLSSNDIYTMPTFAFLNLSKLHSVDLSCNEIYTIPKQALTKTNLQILNISHNKIWKVKPLAFEGLESLTGINLSLNNIDTIVTQAFSKLSKLQSLDLRLNNIKTIEPLAFEGLESLTDIDLSSNNVDTIPTRMFSKLSKLKNLNLYNNQIHSVEPFAFYGLQNLTMLYLDANRIETLENKSFANIPRLESLTLGFNHIRSIAADAFTGTDCISLIKLSFNALTEVPSIGSQPCLSTLDLSQNRIVKTTFPSTYMNSYNNLSVDLSGNLIETLDRFTFSSLAGTTIVDMALSINYISSLGPGTFDPLTSIEKLYLGNNPLGIEALKNIADSCNRKHVKLAFRLPRFLINVISAFMGLGIRLGMSANFSSAYIFEEFRNLTIIRLTKNDLFQFSGLNFPGKKNVLAIDLAENNLSSFPKYLPTSLESLDLRGNKISELHQNEISYLGSLTTLLLARNSIVDISPGAFNGLGILRVLDLKQTRIGSLSRDLFEPLQKLTHLYLGKNGIRFLKKLSHPLVSLRVLDLSSNDCENVDHPFTESFPSLQILHLESNNLGKTGFLSGSGEPLVSGLTALEKVFISSNNIHHLPELILQDQVSLQFLDVSKNQISGWGPTLFKYTRNLAKLDISCNLISVLTENNLHDLKNLKELNLKGNPFVCNCNFLWFRGWIDRTSVTLPDKEFYTCHGPEEWIGRPLLQFTKDKINCTIIPTIVGAISGALLLSGVSVVLVYRNRWRLRLRLYLLSNRGIHFLRDLRGHAQHRNYGAIYDDGRGDHYDAYISRSNRDDDWVLHHLLPGVDNGCYDGDMFGGDFKLYFDPRDKEPGIKFVSQTHVLF